MPTNRDRSFTAVPPSVLTPCLLVLGIISVLSGLAAGVAILSVDATGGRFGPVTVIWMLVALAGGGCLGGVMWALAWLCRDQHRRSLSQGRMASTLERLASTGPQVQTSAAAPGAEVSAPAQPVAGGEILEQLRELNINLLLSEQQRAAKRKHILSPLSKELAEKITQAADDGEPDQCEAHLQELMRIAPEWPTAQLRELIERARVQARQRDIAEASAQAENLMSAGDFDESEAVAKGLLARYPDLEEAAALAERVRREREAFIAEQRLSMYQVVEHAASRRHWRAATEAAEVLLAAHPASPEADAVRAQMGAIRDNARLEEVRERRDRIKNLIERNRYAEAIELAQEVIESFPETAAAEDLRDQMSRLEELAASEEAASQ